MRSVQAGYWSRAFVATGVAWFVLALVANAAGAARGFVVALALYGFVFHVVFGKAYALVPSYFGTALATPRAAGLHLPLATIGTAGLATPWLGGGDRVAVLGGVAWFAGVLVFVGALGWSVRENPTGADTGTGGANEHRRRVDRLANAFVPVVLAYLLVGAAIPVLEPIGVAPGWLPAAGPAATHLLAAGAATLLVFAIGFRLFPRFLVTTPRSWLVGPVLAAGAVAPALLAVDFLGGAAFRIGAVLQALSVLGFAIAFADMYRRSDRRRVGFRGVLAGVAAGALAVLVGLHLAFVGPESGLVAAHFRLALVGFLGLTIVGVSYQFYPPAIAETPGVDDRSPTLSIAAIFAGLVLEAGGHVTGHGLAVRGGTSLALVGGATYAAIVYALFVERAG